jgi:hypothetical protein
MVNAAIRASLQEYRRPLEGGLQVTNSSIPGECTLAFAAAVGGSSAYFVIASHCTPSRWGLDGSVVNQPTSGNAVGYEVLDPSLRWCGLFSLCRTSDMSLIAKYGNVGLDQGRIARTLYAGSGGRGSLTIDNARPYFDIHWK